MDRARRLLARVAGRKRDLTPHQRQGVVTVADGPGRGLRIDLARASADYESGTNELPVQRAVVEALEPGQVFFDIGSNVGFFGLIAAREVGPQGAVVTFEPVPENVERIRRNAQLNGFDHMSALELALSDREGSAELLLAEHPGGATLSTADTPPDLAGSVRVRTATLDALVAAGDVPAPDVVKIDVEGAEFEVLAGMRHVLVSHGPTLVVELDSSDAAVLAAKVHRFHEVMSGLGYAVHVLDDSYLESGWNVFHAVATPEVGSGPGHRSST